MPALDLKLFLHYGEFIEQMIDEMVDLQGADVILANKLMKNHVKEKTILHGLARLPWPTHNLSRGCPRVTAVF